MNDENQISPWNEIIGACYTPASLARALGWAEAEVEDAANSLVVLKLVTADGAVLYPAFQLWNGNPVDGLSEVLRVLRTGTEDPWTWAQWLNTHLLDEDNAKQPTNVQRLRAGQLATVLRDADHDAAAWRS